MSVSAKDAKWSGSDVWVFDKMTIIWKEIWDHFQIQIVRKNDFLPAQVHITLGNN